MNNLKDNTIVIYPDHLKDKVFLDINRTKQLKNIKLMSFKSFIDNYLFSYDEQAIYFLMNKYDIKYDVALMYLKNLYFVENKSYASPKLNKLVALKKELDDNNLLVYNPLFRENIKTKNIVFYNINLTKFNKHLIDELTNDTNVEVVNDIEENSYRHDIYEFKDIDSELEFVATKICELLNNGIDIKNIVLLNTSNEYLIPLKRIFSFFKIPINLSMPNNILSTEIGTFFLNNIDSDIEQTLMRVREQFDFNDDHNLEIYNELVRICNKYNWVSDYSLVKDLIAHDLKTTCIPEEVIVNAVRIISLEQYYPSDDDYVFLVDFSQNSIPILEKDEDYIDDSVKSEINMDTTVEKNEFHHKISLSVIKNTKNMWISYKKYGSNGQMEMSTLNNSLNYPIIHHNTKYNYSDLNNIMTLSKHLDDYLKYGVKSPELSYLYSNYPSNNYRSYNNAYTHVDSNIDELTLSYSSLDNYYKCAFRYYVNSILKINIYEEKFANYLGSLFHFVLSKKDELSLNEAWDLYLQEHEFNFTNKEKFFLTKSKKELEFILDTLEIEKTYTNFDQNEYELKIEINKDNNVKFVGIVDKIMSNQNHDLGAIIDYKTGNPSLNLNNIIYGLNLQLPIYLYLINHKYPNMEIVGFYLQKILPTLIYRDPVKALDDQRRELLKLQGYSLSELEKLKEFDKTCVDSELIKSMKMGNNGFYAYAKTLNHEQMERIIKLVDTKINDAIDNIKQNNFAINPKQIGTDNVSCPFCQFKDICYMNNKDIVHLSEVTNLDFLEGD